MLFQTLNTSNRGFRLPNGQNAIMLDTVGFITDLPHGLVESFKATLDQIHEADVLVHVRDISHPQTDHQKQTVINVLKEIGVSQDILDNKYIEVWNKMDLVKDPESVLTLAQESKEAKTDVIVMSCTEAESEHFNKSELLEKIGEVQYKTMGK